ncbi:hypothetical protein [Acanthopleuribacter pedis]|uniref:Uncharacterized protein n=1 Tax=Acanthopleuribacter pedis TaxID=442870 RepID=A0A8J7U7Z3_9BACT|nr:hypothetical protein [Acanthopleuribacter pedis]MBO1321921.1 hypothetical protein [Acanthopleuribacter pedis]
MSVTLAVSVLGWLVTADQTPVTHTVRLTDQTQSNFKALQSQLAASNPGDTIELRLAPTANHQPQISFSAPLVVSQKVTITFNNTAPPGFGHPVDNVVFDGGGQVRLFEIKAGGELVLKSAKLINGNAGGSGLAGQGGAILNQGTLTLIDCHFTKNDATYGGAVASLNASLHLANGNAKNSKGFSNQMVGNRALYGTALYAEGGRIQIAAGKPPNFSVRISDQLALGAIRAPGQPVTWPTYLGIGNNFGEVTFVNPVLVANQSGGTGPGSLRHAVAQAADNEVIVIPPSINTITLDDIITISKNITIVGPAKIDGARKHPLINITGGNVRLVNLRLENGFNNLSGGAITNHGMLHLIRCRLAWNHSNSDGGGLANETHATLYSFSSFYWRNSAVSRGGGLRNNGTVYMGALSRKFSVSLVYPTFFRLKAYNGDGIDPGTVSNNIAGQGGGIYSSNTQLLGQLFLKAGSSVVAHFNLRGAIRARDFG